MSIRHNWREGRRDREDAMMEKSFRGDDFRGKERDTEEERGRGHDGEMGAGREVGGKRDGNTGGPFRQGATRGAVTDRDNGMSIGQNWREGSRERADATMAVSIGGDNSKWRRQNWREGSRERADATMAVSIGGDNGKWRRQNWREGSRDRGDTMMDESFRGDNFRRGERDIEGERQRGHDANRGAGREVGGERDGDGGQVREAVTDRDNDMGRRQNWREGGRDERGTMMAESIGGDNGKWRRQNWREGSRERVDAMMAESIGGDNGKWRRQNWRQGRRERGDTMMDERFRGYNFRRAVRDPEGVRGRGHDGERGTGREVGGERDDNRGGPFRQRYNDRQQAGQPGDRAKGRGQRGGHMDQNVARSRREGYRTQENTRYGQTQGRHPKNQGNFRPLSSRLLSEILEKDPSEAATELGSLKGSLQAGLNEDLMSEVQQHLLWEALAFICGALGAEQTVIMLLTMALESKLCRQHLLTFLTNLRRPRENIDARRLTILKNVITVFHSAMQSLPSRASDLKVAVTLISDAVSDMDEDDKHDDIMESIKSLSSHIEDIEKERERKRQMDRISKNPPPDDFRQQDILPTVKELQPGYQPFLRPHLTRGVYADADHYLDVQFRLLKEDFIYPLRNGISEYLTSKKANPGRRVKLQDVRIYEEAHYEKSVRDFSGISHYMAFKRIPLVRWHLTKRLIYGSLLILSTDDFKSYIFATVAKRDVQDLEKGMVAIALVGREDASCLLNKRFVMAESSVFFEAYRPVLLGLQRMSGPCLPFSQYTLSMFHDVKPPKYLQDRMVTEDDEMFIYPCRIDISPLLKGNRRCSPIVAVLDDGAWPDIDDVQLDQSQYEAAKTALTKELSVIQGPPGTGKTHIGLKIVETLLLNREAWSSEENPTPILLVCYTNHALDQFLEGILTFHHTGIVRVGSRSKSEKLQPFNLSRMVGRRGIHDEEYVQRRVRDVKEDVDATKRRVDITQARIEGARNGIIDEFELGPFMSWRHYNSLLRLSDVKQSNSWLVEWLLCERHNDRDWNGQEKRYTIEQSDNLQEDEKKESTKHVPVANETTIELEYERNAIEYERLIDDEYGEEDSDEDEEADSESNEDEDYPFLGLEIDDLDKAEDGVLRRFIQKKMYGKDVLDPGTLKSIKDVWRMHPNDRWALYHIWLQNYLQHLKGKLSAYDVKFKQLCGQLDEAKGVGKYHVLRQATIIGMTTTGAANHQQVLQRVRPKIVIVEEAAEVLEAHIITALNASCQQLILIGDHQQLRPKPNVYFLAKKYHLDVSLFERLINNGFPYSQLELQHRMRIELSDLMRRHFYDNLQDHDTVKQYESVKAVQKDIFFLDHAEPEDEMDDTQSHYNLHESRLVVALCYYFLQQGYEPDKVTILTAYTGQLLKIKQMMDQSKFEGVKVTSIDNYQGEENDIILLSFVRSNNHGRIGFLGISNRVCVSLSRAKKGIFCVGNFTLFAEKSELWKGIVTDLEGTGSIGDSLTLQCTNHPEERTAVKTADDFKKVPLGGCNRDCDTRLDCGHVCRLKCHPTDLKHLVYKCKAPCSKVICERNHKCPKLCSDLCSTSCSVIVEKLLPCLHVCKRECKTDIRYIMCEEKVDKTLGCSHVHLLPCHMPTKGLEKECEVIIKKELQCGHRKTEKCNGSGRCDEIVLKVLGCNHTCQAACHKDPENIRCKENVEKTLPCGHTHTLLCSTSIVNVLCNTITRKSRSCGHEIIEKCCHNSKCSEVVEKTLPCGHKLKIICSIKLETVECKERCIKQLPCNHICKERCGVDCTEYCTEIITRDDWSCGHEVTVKCCEESDACYIACEKILICGHKCKGTCGKCSQGRYHHPCIETCKKKLVCGHECALNCGAPCLSCEKKCPLRCRHSQCKHPCSKPCYVCMKRCTWKCEHFECKTLCCEPCDRPPCNKPCSKKRKCGHPCIGLCGEICPNKCRTCDKEDLEKRFFGTEDIQTARYIQLEDCGHYFEVEGLDKFLGFGIKSDGAEIFTKLSVKTCPRCEKPIQLSRRYNNLLRESSAIKPRIVEKLQGARNSSEDKHLLRIVNSAVMSARETIPLLSPKLSSGIYSALFEALLERKSMVLLPFRDKLQELLLASTEELERHSKSLPNVLVDQHANDLWNEMNRVTIMCDLAEVLRGGPNNQPKYPDFSKSWAGIGI
ncbi:NFX1-type zinc finger-containing protein 1 [Strongylocentrotus purpuratus]|uniref:4Fe-4S ferredoxin-type domain-containing protein n=1 Tax=Strongylocentrotus purpuratus TaxID=7668 RepID=A0A7M7N8C6_STRPU|nr:NFX1-type zinc finger-containing protein 1 [Strongylocentrotus purpuratus]